MGFIGSNLIKTLNSLNYYNIIIVDNFQNGKMIENVNDLIVHDFLNTTQVVEYIKKHADKIEVVFHSGAISDTTCWDAQAVMENNFHFSKALVNVCVDKNIKFIYASSASVYGSGTKFKETTDCELPVNLYAYSKLLFDQYIRQSGLIESTQPKIYGLRYFNVYGPREKMKKHMASPVFKLAEKIIDTGFGELFGSYLGYAPGEQCRDFIYVSDVVDVNLWLWRSDVESGIYNVGTGKSTTFNLLGEAVIETLVSVGKTRGRIRYIDFPDNLKGFYQSFTEADMSKLRSVGYNKNFIDIKQGIKNYFDDEKSGLDL